MLSARNAPWTRILPIAMAVVIGPGTRPQVAGAVVGGHPLEFGLSAGYTDFDAAIRFENDAVFGMNAAMGIASWFRLGFDLSTITAYDRDGQAWISAITTAIVGRVEPWPAARISGGGLFGVSFMAFEERPNSDSVSEGFDLGPSVRLSISPRWILRGDLFWRMQTFRLVPVDANGLRTGEREETGYLWSRIFRMGLSHVF
jgi:hypothetical protein